MKARYIYQPGSWICPQACLDISIFDSPAPLVTEFGRGPLLKTGARRSEPEMFAEYKLQPVDILREEALLSLPRDLELDSNPWRVCPAALHMHTHMHLHTNRLFLAVHVLACEHIWCAPIAATCKGPQVMVSHTPTCFSLVFMSYHIK